MPSHTTHNTPALRFSGYTGVWEQHKLEDTEGTYPAINSNDLSQLIISVPNPDDQQKIDSFFHHLDDLINCHEQYTVELI